MKPTLYTVLCALALPFVFSCVKEVPEGGDTPEVPKGNLTIKVDMESSRSTLDGLSPEWAEGDVLSAVNATGNYRLWLVNAATGEFSGDVEGDYPFLIAYPYNEDITFSSGTATLSVPSTQTLAYSQNVAPGALVAAAVLSSGNSVTLKNLVSLVKLELGRGDVSSVSLSSTTADEPLSGTIRFSAANPDAGITITSGTDAVTLEPEGDHFEPGTYWMSVIPRTVSGVNFTFSKANDGGTHKTKSKVVSTTFARSGSLNFGTFLNEVTYTISNKAELIAWKNNRNDWTAWDFVKITDNIDLDGEYWPGPNFSGELDGGGHAITNIRIERGEKWICFFGTVSGYIHDLTLGSEEDDSYFHSTLDAGTSEGYAAPIGQVTGGRIKNITNYVPVEATGTAISCVAGICAYYASDKPAEGLINYASVSISSSAQSYNYHIGGIIGASRGSAADCKLSGCENYGEISFTGTSSKELRMGGIIGALSPAISAHQLTDCENHGDCLITSTASIGNTVYLGGIAGYCNNGLYSTTLSGCGNSATVASRAGTCTSMVLCGGIVGKSTANTRFSNCYTTSTSLVENTAIGNKIWIGGIAGETQGSNTLSGCTNEGTVRNSGDSCYASSESNADISVGGIVGTISSTGTSLTSCVNDRGTISSSGNITTSENPISVGGVVGCDYGGSSIRFCSNSGALSSSTSNGTKRFASVGGILARNNYRKANITSCANTGDISVTGTNSNSSYYDMGGILGLGLDCGTDISSCSANCSITYSISGEAQPRPGMAFARILAKGAATCTVQSTGIAGSVNGNAITASNWNTIYALYAVAEGNTTVVTDGGANSCYFIQ